MNQQPTYVLADDGLWYRNPIIRGIGWYLCFDDIDPAEVVIAYTQLESGHKGDQCAQAVRLLRDVGISAAIHSFNKEGARCFDGKSKIVSSVSIFVYVTAPIPAIHIRGLTGITLERARKKSPCLEFCGTSQVPEGVEA